MPGKKGLTALTIGFISILTGASAEQILSLNNTLENDNDQPAAPENTSFAEQLGSSPKPVMLFSAASGRQLSAEDPSTSGMGWGANVPEILANLDIDAIAGLSEGQTGAFEYPTHDGNKKAQVKISKFEHKKMKGQVPNKGRALRGTEETVEGEIDYKVVTFDSVEEGVKTQGYIVMNEEGIASGIIRTHTIGGETFVNHTTIMIRPALAEKGQIFVTSLGHEDIPKFEEEVQYPDGSTPSMHQGRGLTSAEDWQYPPRPASPVKATVTYKYPTELVDFLAGAKATPAQRQRAINMDAAAIFELTKTVIDNSGLSPYFSISLRAAQEIPRGETGDSSRDLTDIAAARVAGEDFVVYISGARSYCGRGFLPMDINNLDLATIRYRMTNVVGWHCAVSRFSGPHEFGHNLNGDHNYASAYIRAQFPTSYAYMSADYMHGTVLSYMYSPEDRTPSYSHPGTFKGATVGVLERENNVATMIQYFEQLRAKGIGVGGVTPTVPPVSTTPPTKQPTNPATGRPTKPPTPKVTGRPTTPTNFPSKFPTNPPTKFPTKATARPTPRGAPPTHAPTVAIEPVHIQHVVYTPGSYNAPLNLNFKYKQTRNSQQHSERRISISNGQIVIKNASGQAVDPNNYILNTAVLEKIKLVAAKKILFDIDDTGKDIRISYIPIKMVRGKPKKLPAQLLLTLKDMHDIGAAANAESTLVTFPGMDGKVTVTSETRVPATKRPTKPRRGLAEVAAEEMDETLSAQIRKEQEALNDALTAPIVEEGEHKVSINDVPNNMMHKIGDSLPEMLQVIHMAENNPALKDEMKSSGFLKDLFNQANPEVVRALFAVLKPLAKAQYGIYVNDKSLLQNEKLDTVEKYKAYKNPKKAARVAKAKAKIGQDRPPRGNGRQRNA